jgi:hypothetical protein
MHKTFLIDHFLVTDTLNFALSAGAILRWIMPNNYLGVSLPHLLLKISLTFVVTSRSLIK